MSSALYRLGRFAARHPWRSIGLWLIAAMVVVALIVGYVLAYRFRDLADVAKRDANEAKVARDDEKISKARARPRAILLLLSSGGDELSVRLLYRKGSHVSPDGRPSVDGLARKLRAR